MGEPRGTFTAGHSHEVTTWLNQVAIAANDTQYTPFPSW